MRFKAKKRCPFCDRLLNKSEFSSVALVHSDLMCCECNSHISKDDAMKICREKGFSDVWGKTTELEYTYSVTTRFKKGKSLRRKRIITFLDNCMTVEDDYMNDDKKEIGITKINKINRKQWKKHLTSSILLV